MSALQNSPWYPYLSTNAMRDDPRYFPLRWRWLDGAGDKPGCIEARLDEEWLAYCDCPLVTGSVRVYKTSAYIMIELDAWGAEARMGGGDGNHLVGNKKWGTYVLRRYAEDFFADPPAIVAEAIECARQWATEAL